MGADLAAVHAADPRSPRILDDLETRTGQWLLRAVRAAVQHTARDYAAWSARQRQPVPVASQRQPLPHAHGGLATGSAAGAAPA